MVSCSVRRVWARRAPSSRSAGCGGSAMLNEDNVPTVDGNQSEQLCVWL